VASLSIIICAYAISCISSLPVGVAEELGFGYVRRGAKIHFEGGGRTGADSTRIDEPSRENIAGFGHALGRPIRVCSSLDAASFEPLSVEYSRDKNHVYYKWISPGRFLVVELPEADVASFKPLNLAHAIDKNAIWYLDEPIPDSDPVTAELIGNRMVKDSKRVYFAGEPQPQLDAETFRSVGSAYYIDANGVYWGVDRVAGADPATFRVLGESFVAVDRHSVYRSGRRQAHLDAGTCKLVLDDPHGYQVVSDNNGVYVNNLKFLHASPADFAMLDKLTGKGGKYIFLVDTWHCTPVTVYREGNRVIAETVLYEQGTTAALATIRAELSADRRMNITVAAPPGKAAAREVPGWQLDVFKRPAMIERIREAGLRLMPVAG
jgi:hypothetical protein